MSMKCPECQTDNPPEARFCMHCGAALPRRCANCGTALPAEARFCMSCGQQVDPDVLALRQTPAEEQTPYLAGERRLATILLADVKGSTALAGRVDTETWVEIMHRVFQVLGAEIYRYGGEIDQYRGDGLVAFFGVPMAHEDDPERAVLAALAMQESIGRYAAELAEQEGADTERPIELLLRVGVNTGEVIAAQVGDRGRHSEDTAMGRAIALAARMESAAEPGTVLVTADTYRLVAPLFDWQSLGEIAVKGVSEPVAVYRPLSHRGATGKVRGIEGLESPLVGRETEFSALQEAVARVQEGIGGIVTLVGEAGIGKSRLVAECRGGVTPAGLDASDLPLQWVEGRCLSYATGTAYSLWLDLLRGLLDVAPDASPVVVREALQAWLSVLCPDCLDDVYPYLGRLLSLPLEEQAEARLRGIEAEGLKVLTYRAMETLVERAAGRQPLVVACEDLHWADPTSLDLLAHVLPLTDRAPLLLLCVLRPETAHACWRLREAVARDYRHRHLDLWLDPLSRDEEATLIANLLRVDDLAPALRERILAYGEGNPFYVEEILRSLIDREIVVYEKSTKRWHATRDVSDIPIPDTLHSVLASRIDRLPAGGKRVLQRASVIGRIFSHRVLAAVAGEGDLESHLLALQRAQMVRERRQLPEREYVFKHYLTVEAAYDGLLHRERRACHRQVAETLVKLYPERLEEQIGTLAHHWERAGETERAVTSLQRAGEQAAFQYANEEAVDFFGRALALVPGEEAERRYALLLARERVHDLCGNREAQQRDLADLVTIAGALNEDHRSAEIALREGNYALWVSADHDAVVDAAQRAIHHAQLAGDVAGEAAGYLLWGKAHYLPSGKTLDAVPRLRQALRLSRAAHSRAIEADCLRRLGLLSQGRSECAAAVSYYEQSLQIYREMGNRMGEGQALNTLGSVHLDMGDYATAKTYLEQGLRLCRETGNRFDEAYALHGLGSASYREAEYSAARVYNEQSLRIFCDVGNGYGKGLALMSLAWLLDQLGDYAQAGTYYEQALDTGQARGGAVVGLGLLHHHLGENEDACERCRQAIDIAQRSGHRLMQAYALTWLGHALAGLGQPTKAVDAYRQALALWRESNQHHLTPDPLAGLARVALVQEDLVRALAHVSEILDYGQDHPALESTVEPLRIYLTCYRVLCAVEDPRAGEILDAAYRLLQERAAGIEDEDLRRSYLENVAAHREIVAVWEEMSSQ